MCRSMNILRGGHGHCVTPDKLQCLSSKGGGADPFLTPLWGGHTAFLRLLLPPVLGGTWAGGDKAK